jgi:hypothetical protein
MAGDGDLDLGALREHLAASRRRGEPFEQHGGRLAQRS